MSVLNRSDLEASPLADLHALATDLGVDGFRRLRKAELITLLLEHTGSEDPGPTAPEAEAPDGEEADGDGPEGRDAPEDAAPRRRRSRGRRGGRRGPAAEEGSAERAEEPKRETGREAKASEEESVVEGTVELLGNGSGFLRVSPPDPSDEDVYISAAQVRRCELVSGDRVAGPVRPPRRSERYPSLVRVDTINGVPADEVAEGTHYEDLPAAFPSERFALGSEDPTLKAIEWLTPVGRGSRVTITGAPRAGKSVTLGLLADALAAQEGLTVSLVLIGVRPEEISERQSAAPAASVSLGMSAAPEAQAQAAERAVETAKRIASRGEHAVVLIDTLDHLPPHAARRLLGAARNVVDGGSLTVIATVTEPVGGETTVIALDAALTSTGRFPALDLVASGTVRPELLVGDAGAEAIAQARAAALG